MVHRGDEKLNPYIYTDAQPGFFFELGVEGAGDDVVAAVVFDDEDAFIFVSNFDRGHVQAEVKVGGVVVHFGEVFGIEDHLFLKPVVDAPITFYPEAVAEPGLSSAISFCGRLLSLRSLHGGEEQGDSRQDVCATRGGNSSCNCF